MSLYVILGLAPGATRREIERAYKRVARKYHPDLNPGDARAVAVFDQATMAYETLLDPDRRRRYDQDGAVGPASPRQSYEFRGFDFSFRDDDRGASTFAELFDDVLARPSEGRRATAEAGADLDLDLEVTFEEAVRGGVREVTATRLVPCRECAAAGFVEVPPSRCPACQGAGATRWVRGHMVFARGCTECGGEGRVRRRACGACQGEGVAPRSDSISVRLPAGLADGAGLRVPDQGHAGRRGGPAGHLYVRISVLPHDVFERDGAHLRLRVPVALHEAALGTRLEVPTIDGPVGLRIPPGTQAGQRFRLRGRGAPSTLGDLRGDLIVEVQLVMPSLIDERSKEIFRELGRIHTEDVRKDIWTGT